MPPAVSTTVGGMLLTPAQLSARHLNGLPLVDPKGRPMSDAAVEFIIKATVAAFQRRYSVRLTDTYVRLGDSPIPGEPGPAGKLTVTRTAPPLVPRAFEGDRHASIKLPVGPVQAVHAVGLRLPGAAGVTVFPPSWIQLDRKNRVVQLFPGGSLGVGAVHMTGFAISALYAGRTIPGAWQVAYTAGYSDEALEGDDADVAYAVGSLATIAALVPGSIDRFTAQGIAGLSASVDGLSQSTQLLQSAGNIKYAALIQAMRDGLQAWEKTFEGRVRGIQVSFV